MALTVEEITKVLVGEDGQATELDTSKANELMKLFNKDVEGLKFNRDQLKTEKEELKAKYKTDLDNWAYKEKELNDALTSAKEQIENKNPEERKFYETQLAQVESGYKSQLAEKDKRISDFEAQIKTFEKKDMLRDMESEFDKAIQTTKAEPSTYQLIKEHILGPDGRNFAPHDTDTGRMFWAADGSGESISNRVDAFMKGENGKRFMKFESFGSGAEGGVGGTKFTGTNPFKTGNITEQMKLFRENPSLYNQLKAQAARA